MGELRKKTLDKAGLADGSVFDLVRDTWEAVASGVERDDSEVAKAVYSKAQVAARYQYEAKTGKKLNTHQKMKIVQDLVCGLFLEPEVFIPFVKAARRDPVALGKLAFSVMPRELNVEVSQVQGVIMVPVRSANADDWQKMADASLGQVLEARGQDLPWNPGEGR